MYLVSIYFDDITEQKIRGFMRRAAVKSGNTHMLDGNVPPHITISAFHHKDEEAIIDCMEKIVADMKAGELQWVSLGCFPRALFLTVVLNEYLQNISEMVYAAVSRLEKIDVSDMYRPFHWLPHTTVAKCLSKEEMRMAFGELQNEFSMFHGNVVRIGLAKTNPYHDIQLWELK